MKQKEYDLYNIGYHAYELMKCSRSDILKAIKYFEDGMIEWKNDPEIKNSLKDWYSDKMKYLKALKKIKEMKK